MISSNVSSIQSHQTYMNNNAHNVANVNSEGYVPRNTTIGETENGNTKANTSLASATASKESQTNLTKELTDQITIEKVTDANVQAIRTQNEMMGSLLDIKA
ncbi:MAG TPA: flagellar basal body rod C-terminal domain-containing protein [Sulfuricurvum sp.]|nr:flagellar basal body rod C-terminal domain-containing protein [Sulfuricurvum sp.]